ncbi:hypothetical protein B0H14DRAFT_2686817, partial [Mycena olivaceomarginata]
TRVPPNAHTTAAPSRALPRPSRAVSTRARLRAPAFVSACPSLPPSTPRPRLAPTSASARHTPTCHPRHCTVCRRVKTPMCCDYTVSASLSDSPTRPRCAVSPLPWRLTASPPPRTHIRFTSSPSSRSPHTSPRTRLRFATTRLPRPPRIPVASLVSLRSSLPTFARAHICTYPVLSASSCATPQRPHSSLSESPLTSSLLAVVDRLLAPSPAMSSPMHLMSTVPVCRSPALPTHTS